MVLAALVLQWFGGSGAEMQQQMRQPWLPPMECRSACAWGAASDPNVICIPRNAVFRFHGWRDPGTGDLMKAVNDLNVSKLPPQMRDFARKHWVNKELFSMMGSDLIVMGKKACN
jgi:hypothetical protein